MILRMQAQSSIYTLPEQRSRTSCSTCTRECMYMYAFYSEICRAKILSSGKTIGTYFLMDKK